MPRTVNEILAHADALARRFEEYQPDVGDERDPEAFAALRQAVMSRSVAEQALHDAVERTRERGYSWRLIGSVVGTSGEAARQRYGRRHDA